MTGMRGIGIDPTVFPVLSAADCVIFASPPASLPGAAGVDFEGVDCGVFFGLLAAN